MTKYQNKYRIESTRLPDWDYSNAAFYFVTICTKDKLKYFGSVIENNVILNENGLIVKEEILKTEEIRNNVKVIEFVVMPNHIHAIIIIEYSNSNKTLGHLISQLKGKITKRIKSAGVSKFAWQCRFYEHIIRNERSLSKIQEYIRLNPLKWNLDEYYI